MKNLAATLQIPLIGASVLFAQSPAISSEQAKACAKSPVEIYQEVGGSVVQVVSFAINPFRVAERVQPNTGSGVVIAPGIVLTNHHVVDDSKLIGVLVDGLSFDAHLLGADPVLDIALIASPWIVELAPVTMGTSADLVVGEPAYVIGYPMGIGRSLTTGIVSGLDRGIPINSLSWMTRYIQTDAPVSGGNSGGPLLDACGKMVGMISMRIMDPQSENIGFALPIDTILPLVAEITEKGHVDRPWHGLYGQMVTPLIVQMMKMFTGDLPQGFLVETVEPGSAADKAGLVGGTFPVMWGQAEIILGGDIITEVNGVPIRSLQAALEVVESLDIGGEVTLKAWRNGEVLELAATLEARPGDIGAVAPPMQRR